MLFLYLASALLLGRLDTHCCKNTLFLSGFDLLLSFWFMLHMQSLTWHKQTKTKNPTTPLSAYLVHTWHSLLKKTCCLSGIYWETHCWKTTLSVYLGLWSVPGFFWYTLNKHWWKTTLSQCLFIWYTLGNTLLKIHSLCIWGFEPSCYCLFGTYWTRIDEKHTVCWSKGSIWSVAVFVVRTERVITHVSLLEKKTNTISQHPGVRLLLSFSYVPDTLLLTCHCWKTKQCIWRFSLLLFCMYLTQFYSDVIAEKTDCLRIWGFDLLLFHMYLTHFYSHGIAKKKKLSVYLGVWFFTVFLAHAGHTFSNLACLFGFFDLLLCYWYIHETDCWKTILSLVSVSLGFDLLLPFWYILDPHCC